MKNLALNKILKILKNKRFTLPFIIITLYILIVFVIPTGGSYQLSVRTIYGYQRSLTDQFEVSPTIFKKRNYNRYKNTILNKEFDDLQAYITVDEPLENSKYDFYIIKSELLGVDSYGLFMALLDSGYFTKESFELIDNVAAGNKSYFESLTNHAKKRNKAAVTYIVQHLSDDFYNQPSNPVGAFFKVKRKLYHYLLL